MKEKIKSIINKISIVDWIILGALIFICFVSFEHADIRHTGGSSYAYLNGHFKDFYEYNKERVGGNNYLPTTYILFAIWNIPLKIFNIAKESTMNVGMFAQLWFKLGTTLLYILTSYVIYKICRLKECSKQNSLLAAFLFIGCPIAVYSQFIFSQYDIITTFFVMLGYYYYLKNNEKSFILCFAIAITCKYFALLVFIPLLLLKEKKIWNIFMKLVAVMSVFGVEVLCYAGSEAFRQGVFGFSATGYIFNVVYDTGFAKVSIIIPLWILLCAYAYFKDCREEEIFEWSLFLSAIVMFICFCLSFWHPQWLLLAMPFLVLGMFFNKRPDIYLLLDLILMGAYIAVVVCFWVTACDQGLLSGGIFGSITSSVISKNFMMKDFLPTQDYNLYFSIFVAAFLVYVVFMYPSRLENGKNISIGQHVGLCRLRYIGGISLFLVPCAICVIINFTQPIEVYSSGNQWEGVLQDMEENSMYEQIFSMDAKQITGIAVAFGTYGDSTNSTLQCSIVDKENNKELGQMTINTEDLIDNTYVNFDFKQPVNITSSKEYSVIISAKNIKEGDRLGIYRTVDNYENSDYNSYAIIDGEVQSYDIAVKVYGK